MSPIKKLLDKIAGNGGAAQQSLQLRGFGKLPESREFLRLSAGEGPAKQFHDWLHAGHADWVRHVDPAKRGRIASTCVYWPVPGVKNLTIAACIWNSNDCASPPRSFPFTFMVLLEDAASRPWLERFSSGLYFWHQLQGLFDPVFRGEVGLQELRETEIDARALEMDEHLNSVRREAESIDLAGWLGSVAAMLSCSKTSDLVERLHRLAEEWRRSMPSGGFGVRLPLSTAFPFKPQAAAWVQWLRTNLYDSPAELTGVFLPQDISTPSPAVTVLTRPLRPGDLQLATTNAVDYAGVEDLSHTFQHLRSNGQNGPQASQSEALVQTERNLWDWANTRF